MANTESTRSTADTSPVRYRVSGMDCAKDAAQIERAVDHKGAREHHALGGDGAQLRVRLSLMCRALW